MNAIDVLRYGHLTFLGSLEPVPESALTLPGACGVWSIKDIVAHLASYEVVLLDILGSLAGAAKTPALDGYREHWNDFNDLEVAARSQVGIDALLSELNEAHAQSLQRAADLSPELCRANGTLPWYGDTYSLDDVVTYMYYGHKREHSAQVDAFLDHTSRQD